MLPAASPVSGSNVKVALRIRPLSAKERLIGSSDCIYGVPGVPQVIANGEKSFLYDAVLDQNSTQKAVFEECVLPLMDKFTQGYNITILAYGQTGSGKTFTMGTGLEGAVNEDFLGIIPRAVGFIFNYIFQEQNKLTEPASMQVDYEAEGQKFTNAFEMYVSFLEIYNEDIIDLLSPHSSATKRPPLVIREDISGEIYLAGLKEEPISCSEDIFELLKKGTLCRTTGSTDMNLNSSRSHAIFTLVLRQVKSELNQSIISKIHFVDLAGSERLKKTNAVGNRVKESISINSGLLALGNVISALSDESGKIRHIPYRNSKLTRLLQDSLGGNSHTVMIACVSPSSDNYSESLSTLNYAGRARNIRNKAVINQESASNSAFEISQLKKQISALKQEIILVRNHASHLEDSDVAVLQRQYDDLLREKIAIEIERDNLLFCAEKVEGNAQIEGYVRMINELRNKINELERVKTIPNATVISTAPSNPFCPGTPAGMTPKKRNVSYSIHDLDTVCQSGIKISDLVGRLRGKLSDVSALNEKSQRYFQFGESIDSLGQDLVNFFADESSGLEELFCTIEQFKKEYATMKLKYDEKIKQLQEFCCQAQMQRDEAIKQRNQPPPQNELTRVARTRYEEKIRKLNSELKDSKNKVCELQRQSKAKGSSNELLVKNLKASLEVAKNERNKLSQKLTEEINKKSNRDFEVKEAKNREKRASDLLIKWKKAFEQQKEILAKRNEQILYAKKRIKALLNHCKTNKISATKEDGQFCSFASPLAAHLKDASSLVEERALCTDDDDFFVSEEDLMQYLVVEIERIKDLIERETRELEVASKIMSTTMSPLKSPQEYKQSKYLEDRKEVLQSIMSFFSNPSRIDSVVEETIKSLVKSKPKSPFKKGRILPYFHHVVQIQLHHTIIELKQTLKRAIEHNNDAELNNSPFRFRKNFSMQGVDFKTESDGNFKTESDGNFKIESDGNFKIESDGNFKTESDGNFKTESDGNFKTESDGNFKTDSNDNTKIESNNNFNHNPKTEYNYNFRINSNLNNSEPDFKNEKMAYVENEPMQGLDELKTREIQAINSPLCIEQNFASSSKYSPDINSNMEEDREPFDLPSHFSSSQQADFSLTPICKFNAHTGQVFDVHIVDDCIYSSSQDGTVKIWSITNQSWKANLTIEPGMIRAVKSHEASSLFVASRREVKRWDIASGKCTATLLGHSDDVYSLFVLNNYLFTGSSDCTTMVWDLRMDLPVGSLTGHRGAICSITAVPENDLLLTGSLDNTIRLYDSNNFSHKTTIETGHSDSLTAIARFPHEDCILTVSRDSSLNKWQITGDQLEDELICVERVMHLPNIHSNWITSLGVLGEDSNFDSIAVVTGDKGGIVKVWNESFSPSASSIKGFKVHEDIVNCMDSKRILNSEDSLLVTGSDKTLGLWRLSRTE